jgi:ATP/maltotriose-dependent transcriptional regulator MalT
VRELLELLATTQPLVLVLDDLHWADSASIELLGSLLHRLPGGPVLLALGMRPRQTRERLSVALERARRDGSLILTNLAPLTRVEADEFLGETVESNEAATLYEESGGNPFYLEQLARTLRRGEGVKPAPQIPLEGVEVPPAVAAALAEELALLSDEARRVVEGAAVAGDPFDPELARAAGGVEESAVLDGLDELLRLDVIRVTDVPRRFKFRHPLVRRAVYESTPGGWRLGAHERTAEALENRGAPPSARAHHVERAARQGDAPAVATLREAGQSVVHRAPASAARWFAGALRLLPEDAPAQERVELLLAHAGTLTAIGEYAEAHSVLLESLALVPEESLGLRVQLTAACAGVESLLGRHEDAHARLHGALNALSDSNSPEGVVLMLALVNDCFFRMEYGPMRGWAGRALATSRPLQQPPLTAAAAAAAAWAGALDGAIPEAQAYHLEAAALVDSMADRDLALRLDAAVNLGGAELYLDRFEEAEAHLKRAIAVARGTGQTDIIPIAFSVLGWVKMVRGELHEGGELLDGAVEGARLSGHDQTLALNLLNRSLTALAAGDLELALATGRESYELTATMDQSLITGGSGVAFAAALLEAGNAEGAVEAIVSRCGGEKVPLMPGTFRAKWLELLTRSWLALGRPGDAERAATCAEAHAAAYGLGLATAMARRARAAVLFDAGDAVGAVEFALASAEAGDGAGVVVEAALSRTLAGRALAEAGDPDRAVAELEEAAAVFESCGSNRYRAEAERELRKLGRPMHRRTRPGKAGAVGIESLTGRELQIAKLVVDRLTNAEIAAELFLSPKTIETHMHNMFNKLSVSSRVELARAVERAVLKEPARK